MRGYLRIGGKMSKNQENKMLRVSAQLSDNMTLGDLS